MSCAKVSKAEMEAQSALATQQALIELGRTMHEKQKKESEARERLLRAHDVLSEYARKEGEQEDDWLQRIKSETHRRHFDDFKIDDLLHRFVKVVSAAKTIEETTTARITAASKDLAQKEQEIASVSSDLETEVEKNDKLTVRLVKLRAKTKNRNDQLAFFTYAAPMLALLMIFTCRVQPEAIYGTSPSSMLAQAMDVLVWTISCMIVVGLPKLYEWMTGQGRKNPKKVMAPPLAPIDRPQKPVRHQASKKQPQPRMATSATTGATTSSTTSTTTSKSGWFSWAKPAKADVKIQQSQPTAAAVSGSGSGSFADRIKLFYLKAAPEKLSDMGFCSKLAERYAGREKELFAYLKKKYPSVNMGVGMEWEPTGSYCPGAAAGGGAGAGAARTAGARAARR